MKQYSMLVVICLLMVVYSSFSYSFTSGTEMDLSENMDFVLLQSQAPKIEFTINVTSGGVMGGGDGRVDLLFSRAMDSTNFSDYEVWPNEYIQVYDNVTTLWGDLGPSDYITVSSSGGAHNIGWAKFRINTPGSANPSANDGYSYKFKCQFLENWMYLPGLFEPDETTVSDVDVLKAWIDPNMLDWTGQSTQQTIRTNVYTEPYKYSAINGDNLKVIEHLADGTGYLPPTNEPNGQWSHPYHNDYYELNHDCNTAQGWRHIDVTPTAGHAAEFWYGGIWITSSDVSITDYIWDSKHDNHYGSVLLFHYVTQ
ncbi:MAG: hypothetical protein ACYC7E_04980 [Armatimonadota bacterium]